MRWHKEAEEPGEVFDLIGLELGNLTASPAAKDFVLEKRSDDNFQLSQRFGMWICGVAEASRDVLENAEFCGWRFLIYVGEEPLLTAVLRADWTFARFSRDPEIREVVEGLQEFESEQGDSALPVYELRYLKVFGLAVRALWLRKIEGAGEDIIIPLGKDLREELGDDRSPARFRLVVGSRAADRLRQGEPF
jgi:hypothetical protein